MSVIQRITIPYTPRAHFAPFHDRTERFACIVAHRRAGKSVATINELIRGAMTCKLQRPRFIYLAPFLKQAKSVIWDYAKHYAAPIPGVKFNEAELRIDFPNGGQVRLFGADNIDALRGIYIDGVVMDEVADMQPRMWSEVIRPALADRKGWAVFVGTPRGRNMFYDLYQHSLTDPEWFSLRLKASETGVVPAEELEAARQMMTPDQYDQEWETSFDAAIQGAYYGPQMQAAEKENRVTRVPYEPHVKVTTAWDLGMSDSTAIWFVQQVGKEIRLIDYYEASGVGLDHYARVLQEKGYIYGEHLLPHDVKVKELGTGVSRLDTLDKLGLRNVRVVAQLGLDDGINAVRGLLPRCWFDAEKTKLGRDALTQYRREFDEKLKAFKNRPLHDFCSHAADAARYLAVGLRDDQEDWSKPLKIDTGWIV